MKNLFCLLARFFSRCEEYFLSLLLSAMTLIVFAEVIARFVFNVGISWAQELTLIINAWLTLLGASYCVREKAHIGVNLLTAHLKGRTARTVTFVAVLACLLYTFFYLYGAVIYVYEDYQINVELQDIPLPTWVAALCLVFGFLLLAIRFIEAGYRVLIKGDLHVLENNSEVDASMKLAKETQQQANSEAT